MQHVASEAANHTFKPALPNPARPAPSSARAPSSPFASLLDDGTQAATAQPPASASNPTRAAKPDSAQAPEQAPAKAKDDKAAKPGDAGNAAETGKTASDGKAPSDGKATADGKSGKPTAAGNDAKSAGDGKPADGAAAAAADAANNPVQTISLAAVVATATAPGAASTAAPGEVPQTAAAADQAAIIAADAPKTDATKADATKTKAAEFAAAQADADKTAAAHPSDEVPANTHHAAPETQPQIAAEPQVGAPKAPTDAAQQASLTPQAPDVSPTLANPAAPAAQAAQAAAVPLAGVAIEIANKALDGTNHFEIRLDPPELGRIEVRLDVDRDGHTTTRLIADRSDTLDLLRRDATGLERALQDAGLKTADNSLQFSLRDQSMGRDQSNTPTPGAAQIVVRDDALPVTDPSPRTYSRLAGIGGGIDIRV